MTEKAKKRKKKELTERQLKQRDARQKKMLEAKAKNFKAVLALPERLAAYLRLWLHLDKATWDFALDKMRQNAAYREWSKSKGRGKGRRYFAAPCDELKIVQKAILDRMLLSMQVHFARHGNQRGSSIISNAAQHAGARHVFSVDIINAFPTVFRSRIRANLRKSFAYGLRQFAGVMFKDDELNEMLESVVDLVCLHDRLPQGPPTSPRILDIVCLKMDTELWRLLNDRSTPFQGYRYTAWADDLTISSSDEIPEELRAEILKTVKDHGFLPHTRADKTRYYSPATGTVPVVTGLVINPDGRLTMAPRKVNQLRARLNYFLKRKTWDAELLGQIAGTLGYIRQVYPEKCPSTIRMLVARVDERLCTERVAAPSSRVAVPAVESDGETAQPAVKRKRKQKKSNAQDVIPLAETLSLVTEALPG